MQPVGDRAVQGALLFHIAAFVPGDLDRDEVVGAGDAKVVRIVDQAVGVVFLDDLEAIILRYTHAAHGVVDDLADALAIFGVLAFTEVDADEWHGEVLEYRAYAHV